MKLIHVINNALKDNFGFRIALLLCGILIIILREPALLFSPRIWAEEGTIFYAFARHHSVWDIFITVHVGYLTLFNSLVSLLQAKMVSVENAAMISTYMGFLVQIIPVYIISFTKNIFWDNPIKKIICVSIIIFAMPLELWLNTTNSHFIFGLITLLILIISTEGLSVFQKSFFRILLFIGGLTGPASMFFTPVFILKAYRDKNKEKYIQVAILILCSVIQACIIIYCILYNNTYHRLSHYDLNKTILAFFIDNFALNVFISTSPFKYYLSMCIALFFIYLFAKNIKKFDYLIFVLSFLFVSVLSTLGSLNMAGAPRYSYIPTCILLIAATTAAFEIKKDQVKTQYFALFLLFFFLALNVKYYRYHIQWIYSPTLPVWKTEVVKWQADTTYHPKACPDSYEWRVKM
jgi:hypothetical protein